MSRLGIPDNACARVIICLIGCNAGDKEDFAALHYGADSTDHKESNGFAG